MLVMVFICARGAYAEHGARIKQKKEQRENEEEVKEAYVARRVRLFECKLCKTNEGANEWRSSVVRM